MKQDLIKCLEYYFNKIDKDEMTMKEFRDEFDSAFEESMIPYIHPLGRDEFKNDFYNQENEGSSK